MAVIPQQTIDGYVMPGVFTFYNTPPNPYISRITDGFLVGYVQPSANIKAGFTYDSSSGRFLRIIASETRSATIKTEQGVPGSTPSVYNDITASTAYTLEGKTVYYGYKAEIYGSSRWSLTINGNPEFTSANFETISGAIGKISWLMVYGGYLDGFNVTYDLVNCSGDSENPSVIPPNATITRAFFTPDENYSFNSGSCWIDGDGFPSGTPIVYRFNYETGELVFGVVTSNITIHVTAYADPYSEIDGESEITGGSSVPIPQLPPLTATASGIIGLFAPSTTQMRLLADYMWTDFGGTGSTEVDVLKEIVQALKRTIANPLDFVVGLNIIPSHGLSIGSDTQIRFGFVNSNVTMPRLTSQYFVVDCGTLSFDTLCGNTFLDYAPYSKFSIYLPYIGFKDVDPNDFVGHTIGVIYHGDVVTGGITAYITKDGSVMYQYSGCCALSIPLNADGWGSTIAGAVQIATSVIVGGATGSSAGVVAGAVNGAANVASNPSLLSPTVMRSGAISGGAGCMGVQTPFVVREAVRFHPTTKFNTISGYPAFYYRKLSTVHGYTTVYDCHIHGVNATDNEINEIERLLKEGVIF